jgi:methionyl-tRNA formyltransferase
MIRVVFFGSSDSVFSNRHFLQLAASGCAIAGVVDVPPERRATTNASRPEGGTFVESARAAGIPCFEPARAGDPRFLEEMKALHPDLFMAAGYMLLLGPKLLAVPRIAAANFHASLLPAYRGKHPVFWALRNGEPECGLTVHEMSAGLDTGAIIFQVRVPVRAGDSVSSLYERIMAESLPLVSRLVDAAARGEVPRKPQPAQGASYFGATAEKDFRIDWSMEPARIARWVAATPGQCFFAAAGDRKLFLLDAASSDGGRKARPGELMRLGRASCLVAASGGAIEIRSVRVGAGPVTSAFDALKELDIAEGDILGGA